MRAGHQSHCFTLPQPPRWVSDSGLEWGETTGGAGKALTIFPGLGLPEAAQDKISRLKAGAANLMGSTWPWHQTGTSTLLCQPHASHRKEGFILCCFLFLREVFGEKGVWTVLRTHSWQVWSKFRKGSRLMKREGGSCTDQSHKRFWIGKQNSPRRKKSKCKGTIRSEGLLRAREELQEQKDAQVSGKITDKEGLLLSA